MQQMIADCEKSVNIPVVIKRIGPSSISNSSIDLIILMCMTISNNVKENIIR